MEQEEEDSLATGNTGGGPCWHCTHRRHSYPRDDNWHPRLRGKEGEAYRNPLTRCDLVLSQLSSG